MYLFRETNDNIETFIINPNLEKVKQFKTSEIEKIPHDYRILNALGCVKVLDEEPFYLNWNNLLDSCGDSRVSKVFHMLRKYDFTAEENKRQEKLLTDYYSGSFDDRRVIRVKPYREDKKEIYGIPKNVEYLLLTRRYEERTFSFCMDDIIVLTKPLYLYELMIRSFKEHDYKSIIGQDISSHLQLFDVSKEPYKVFPKNMVQDAFNVGLLDSLNRESNYSEFIDDVRQSGMVLEKSLKYSNKIL